MIKEGTEFIDQLKDNLHHYYDENQRLNEEKDYFQKGFISMHDRIDKAIEYIGQRDKWYKNEEYKLLKTSVLLEILKGEDDE